MSPWGFSFLGLINDKNRLAAVTGGKDSRRLTTVLELDFHWWAGGAPVLPVKWAATLVNSTAAVLIAANTNKRWPC